MGIRRLQRFDMSPKHLPATVRRLPHTAISNLNILPITTGRQMQNRSNMHSTNDVPARVIEMNQDVIFQSHPSSPNITEPRYDLSWGC